MLFASLLAAAQSAHAQQQFPTKEVRLVVPFPASGGGADLAARLIAESLRSAWGQPVIIDGAVAALVGIGGWRYLRLI
jgi:tripartite-type tricarboxylate transporter receptor subunit TctC